jgi:hypothetical protein
MKTFSCRLAVLCALLLVALPALAQRVKYEANGQADVTADNFMLVEAAVIRDVTGLAPSSMGQVVFFRSDRPAGDAPELQVREGDADLHALPGGGYFVAVVPPGMHHYSVNGQVLSLDVEAGRCYYLRAADNGGRSRLAASNAMVFLNAAGSRPLPRM